MGAAVASQSLAKASVSVIRVEPECLNWKRRDQTMYVRSNSFVRFKDCLSCLTSKEIEHFLAKGTKSLLEHPVLRHGGDVDGCLGHDQQPGMRRSAV